MKILHISTGKVWRGGERQTLFLIGQQLKDGHEVHLLSNPDIPLLQKVKSLDVISHTLRTSPIKLTSNGHTLSLIHI